MTVTPRDVRSADFAGASLTGPGPLAAGVMSFTTPVPLPATAASARSPGARHLPAQHNASADRHCQEHASATSARTEHGAPHVHAHQEALHGGNANLHMPGAHVTSPGAHEGNCTMDMSPSAGSAQLPHLGHRRDLPTQAIYRRTLSSEQAPRVCTNISVTLWDRL